MKTKVVYHSRTGNTKKVAEAIAESLACIAESVEKAEITEPVDVLFIGAAVYATYDHDFSPEIKSFVEKLNPQAVKKVAIFSTHAFGSSIEKLHQILVVKGLSVTTEEYTCKGRFLFFNWKSPTPADLLEAQAFAQRVTQK